MPQIGEFTRTKNGYAGHIRTLSLDAEIVLVPAEHTDAENAPDYRVTTAAMTAPRSAPDGNASVRKPATTSPCRSTIPPWPSQSAPICSNRPKTNPPGICTGTARPSAASGTERCPARAIKLSSGGQAPSD